MSAGTQLGPLWVEVRRVAVGDLASDFDPAAGELPPKSEWCQIGAANTRSGIRVVGFYVDADSADLVVPGGTWDVIPVEPVVTGIVNGDVDEAPAANGRAAVPVFGATASGLSGGEGYLITGITTGAITFAVAGGTAPGGDETHLVILARSA